MEQWFSNYVQTAYRRKEAMLSRTLYPTGLCPKCFTNVFLLCILGLCVYKVLSGVGQGSSFKRNSEKH